MHRLLRFKVRPDGFRQLSGISVSTKMSVQLVAHQSQSTMQAVSWGSREVLSLFGRCAMTKRNWCGSLVCVVGALAWGACGSTAIAQDVAAPDLERAAAAEVRRREAAVGVERGGLDATVEARPRVAVVPGARDGGLDAVARAVNGELTDVARALRRLDQSYAVRGFQGCGAWTAGSVFVDWRAKGVKPQDRVAVLPPDPIVLGRPKAAVCCRPCSICGGTHLGAGGCSCGATIINVPPAQPARPCCDGPSLPTPTLLPMPVPLEGTLPAPAR